MCRIAVTFHGYHAGRLKFAAIPFRWTHDAKLRRKIVPTVNAASSASVEKMLGHFLEFMDLSSDRKRLESYFCKPSTANVSRCGVVDPPSVEAPRSSFGASAEKRRKVPDCSAAGPARLLGSRGRHAGGESFEELDATVPARGGCQGASRVEGGVPRPRVIETHAAVGGTSTGGASSSVPASSSAAPVISVGGDDAAVELHLGDIDVEAQKAIMADIERRKSEDRRGRGCERREQTPRESARRAPRSSEGIIPKARAGKGRTAPGSSAKRAAAPSGPNSSGGDCSAGRAVGVNPRARTAAVAAVATPKPEVGFDGQQVLSVDDESAGACSPMDIRDFFSRRG